MSKDKASLRGTLIRGSIKLFIRFPQTKHSLVNKTELTNKKLKVPKGYELRQHDLDGLFVEMLVNKKGDKEKVILQFYGGAYIMGHADYDRIIAHKYSTISNDASIVSVNLRNNLNHSFPQVLDDAIKVWNWLIEYGYKEENIIVVGDSLGGNLTLSLTMKLRDEGRKLPKALILMSPFTDFTNHGESYVYNMYNDSLFGKKRSNKVNKFEKLDNLIKSYAGNNDYKNKYISPSFGDFLHFPPILIQVGSYEVLESDAILVYRKAKQANVDVKLTRYLGMFHDFQMLLNLIPESKEAWKEVEMFIQFHFN